MFDSGRVETPGTAIEFLERVYESIALENSVRLPCDFRAEQNPRV